MSCVTKALVKGGVYSQRTARSCSFNLFSFSVHPLKMCVSYGNKGHPNSFKVMIAQSGNWNSLHSTLSIVDDWYRHIVSFLSLFFFFPIVYACVYVCKCICIHRRNFYSFNCLGTAVHSDKQNVPFTACHSL